MNHDSDRHYRHTKIIATLGPATQSVQRLTEMIAEGVDVIRLNMAHGSCEWVQGMVARIRQISDRIGRHVAVMMDVKGPEIRTGHLNDPISLSQGDRIRFYTSIAEPESLSIVGPTCSGNQVNGSACGTAQAVLQHAEIAAEVSGTNNNIASVFVNYPDLTSDIQVGATILVDSGLLRLKVLEKDSETVVCEALSPGILGSHRHINLPGVRVNLPALTEKDRNDLRAGVKAGVDFVALSFVRSADDIKTLRAYLDELGSTARIIAKIEEQAGIESMNQIVCQSDAVMVARGDLGIEIDYHTLPLIQTRLVRTCQAEGKPVIIATHLLESMIQSPMPTRAEISDVATAVREQADAVMLSGETTTGNYPLESVQVMKNIIRSIEPTVGNSLNGRVLLREPKSKMLRSAAMLAQELEQSGIIVFTRSGLLAYLLAALRPRGVPIYAFTDDEKLFRQLLLPWGVEPFLMDFSADPEQTIADAIGRLRNCGWTTPDTHLVVITNALANGKVIDSLQLRKV